MNDSTKRFIVNQMMWLGIYFAISIVISMLLPFPISLGVLIAVIIGLSMYRRKQLMRRMGQSQGSFFGGGFSSPKGVEYYCMSCGIKHNNAACPNCGSRMKRVGF